jgi:hypothetical protein
LLGTTTSLQTRIDRLQGELRHYKKIVESASSRPEQYAVREGDFDGLLRRELKGLAERVEAQQRILSELVRAEARQSGQMKRVERLLGLGVFDRLSRHLRKRK